MLYFIVLFSNIEPALSVCHKPYLLVSSYSFLHFWLVFAYFFDDFCECSWRVLFLLLYLCLWYFELGNISFSFIFCSKLCLIDYVFFLNVLYHLLWNHQSICFLFLKDFFNNEFVCFFFNGFCWFLSFRMKWSISSKFLILLA